MIPSPPPTVSITSPNAGATVIKGETITLSAVATDDTSVSSIVFAVNGVEQAPETSPPFLLGNSLLSIVISVSSSSITNRAK